MHGKAKKHVEIENEKEILETSIVQAMEENKYGNIEKSKLEEILESNIVTKKVEIEEYGDELIVNFTENNRYYHIDDEGNVNEYDYNSSLIKLIKEGSIEIGDYVQYEVGIGKDTNNGAYSMGVEQTGYSLQQNFNVTTYTGTWQVLYNGTEGFGLQLISNNNVLENEENGLLYLGGKTGYNNIVQTLNKMAGYYINNEFAQNARSLGSLPTDIETSIGTMEIYENDEYDYIAVVANDLKISDENYLYDIAQLRTAGNIKVSSENSCWVAGRLISGNSNNTYFRGASISNVNITSSGQSLVGINLARALGGSTNLLQSIISKGEFRPVIILKSTLKATKSEDNNGNTLWILSVN